MSNPSICYLAQTQINGIYLGIEDNLGEAIHIHYGDVRINMSISEFIIFSDCVMDSVRELLAIKGINWKLLDSESYKEEWMGRYSKISRIEKKNVTLGSLYMKESYIKKRSIKRIIKLSESGYILYFKGNSEDNAYYNQQGVYEPSRGEKARSIEKQINCSGYPIDNKKILIDQNGYILDGLKRASYLRFLHDDNYIIPVIMMHIEWEYDFLSKINDAEIAIRDFEEKGYISKHDNKIEETQNVKLVDYKRMIQIINKCNDDYVLIQDVDGLCFDFFAVVIMRNRIGKEIAADLSEFIDSSFLDEYYFAYEMNKPFVCRTNRGNILFCDKYFVKSKFVDFAMMPLDKKLQLWLWNGRVHECQYDVWKLDDTHKMLLSVINCVLCGQKLPDRLIDNIENSETVFDCIETKNLFETVFYKYTDYLVEKIMSGEYESAVNDYVTFAEY